MKRDFRGKSSFLIMRRFLQFSTSLNFQVSQEEIVTDSKRIASPDFAVSLFSDPFIVTLMILF